MKYLIIGLMSVSLSQWAFAHADHETPGALPLPMHGGKVGEAKHMEKHKGLKGAHGKEFDLFYEVKYQGKSLEIFPYALDPDSSKKWIPLDPKKDLSGLKVEVELPREKKKTTLSPLAAKDRLKVNFDAKSAYRFILRIEAVHQKEKKLAKIQVEK